MTYKGDPIVLVGVSSERNEYGAWITIQEFIGADTACIALANTTPLGPTVLYQKLGDGRSMCRITYGILTPGTEQVFERWEVDREVVDKDIMQSPAFVGISDAGKQELKRWRADPSSDLDTTKGTNTGTDPGLMNSVKSLVLLGVEVVQVATLVLKRSRQVSGSYVTAIDLSERTKFYSTGALLKLAGSVPFVKGVLPVDGGTKPANSQWGWLPRQSNRSFIGRGVVEEQEDWVWAAWSTILYQYVA